MFALLVIAVLALFVALGIDFFSTYGKKGRRYIF